MHGPVCFPDTMSAARADLYLEEYPVLRERSRTAEVYRGILAYLDAGSFLDDRSDAHYAAGYVVAPHETINEIAGNDRCARRVLEQFRHDVGIRIQIEPYNRAKGQARSVLVQHRTEFEERLIQQSLEDAQSIWVDQMVFRTLETQSEREARQRLRTEEARRLSEAQCPAGHPALKIQEFIHTQPIKSLVSRLAGTAHDVIARIAEVSDQKLRQLYASILEHTKTRPRQIVHPVPGSDRLYAYKNIQHYQRDIRKASLKGDLAGDLACVQLAAASKLWGVRSIYNFLWEQLLGRRSKPWGLWLDFLGLGDQSELYKPVIKEAVYATTFGASEKTVFETLAFGETLVKQSRRRKLGLPDPEAGGLGEENATRLLQHPMMAELLTQRRQERNRIWERGGAVDANGNWLTLPGRPTRPQDPDYDVRSIMARQMQSFEVALMNTMIPTLQEYDKYVRIHLWMHDGMVLHFTKKAMAERIERQLGRDVYMAAKRHDIPTWIEFE